MKIECSTCGGRGRFCFWENTCTDCDGKGWMEDPDDIQGWGNLFHPERQDLDTSKYPKK